MGRKLNQRAKSVAQQIPRTASKIQAKRSMERNRRRSLSTVGGIRAATNADSARI